MIECGADPDRRNSDVGWTPLHYACQEKAIGVVRFLLDEGGADSVARENHDITPFVVAANVDDNWEIALLLLQRGALRRVDPGLLEATRYTCEAVSRLAKKDAARIGAIQDLPNLQAIGIAALKGLIAHSDPDIAKNVLRLWSVEWSIDALRAAYARAAPGSNAQGLVEQIFSAWSVDPHGPKLNADWGDEDGAQLAEVARAEIAARGDM